MVGIYFSGTGNSKYAVELFCKEYDKEFSAYSIEDTEALCKRWNIYCFECFGMYCRCVYRKKTGDDVWMKRI